MLVRIVATIAALAIFWIFGAFFDPAATLALGKAAGAQFLQSDAAFMQTSMIFSFFSAIYAFSSAILAAALALIWVPYLIKKGKELATMTLLVAVAFALTATDGRAYFDTTDKTEAYTILPNESAFWIPDVGNNKVDQAQFDSEDYLKANKLAVKRFVIPHAKLSNTGGYMGWDYYVPTGRLILVDRSPFSHEWVDAADRGSSSKKEGFPCQSKEGLNITAGVSIAASVSEADGARFLYNFGVTPPKGDRGTGQVIFASVYFGRSLAEVMGDFGRKRVQTFVCNEIGKRIFDKVNEEMIQMMDEIEKKATAYFKTKGITIDFIGWGDTLEFDKPVQDAVNRLYVAKIDAQIASSLAPQLSTLQGIAIAESFRARGLPNLPGTVVGPIPDLASMLKAYLDMPKSK